MEFADLFVWKKKVPPQIEEHPIVKNIKPVGNGDNILVKPQLNPNQIIDDEEVKDRIFSDSQLLVRSAHAYTMGEDGGLIQIIPDHIPPKILKKSYDRS